MGERRADEPTGAATTVADELAREIRRRRKAIPGLSQRILGTRIGYTRQYVSMAEWEDANLPSYELVSAIDKALGANGELIALRARATTEQTGRRTAPHAEPPPHTSEGTDAIDVLRRVHALARSVDPEIVRALRANTAATIEGYESLDHGDLVATLTKQRAWVDELVDECSRPQQRQQLFEVAGETSGLLGYLAVGRGEFPLARAYCLEAYTFTDLAEDPNLRAWARGLQSFCEYYAGRFADALDYAQDGLACAPSGPQNVRLMINGAARAMGKLRDAEGVRRAVDTAYEMLAHHNPPDGIPSSVSLGCYSETQTASNAATAYVALGMPDKVEQYAALALPEISKFGSPWSRSLVAIDLAHAQIAAKNPDLDRATNLVLSALETSSDKPIISVRNRAAEFVRDARNRWGSAGQLDTVRDAVAALSNTVPQA